MSGENYTAEANRARGHAYAYLLGELDEAEQFRFERDYLADEAAYDAYLAAQDELIESYLAGELSHVRRERFAKHFLNTEQRRERLRLIQALDEHAGAGVPRPDEAARHAADPPRLTSRLRALLVRPRPRFKLAFQAAALAAIAIACLVGWRLLVSRRDARHEQARTAPQASPPQSQPGVEVTAATPETTPAPTAVAEQPQPTPTPAGAPRPAERQTAGASYALTLSPLSLRGAEDGGANVLRLTRSGEGVLSLRLTIEDAGDITRARAEVNSAEGVRVYAGGGLRVLRRGGVSFVTLKLSTALLAEGDYTIKLTGAEQGDPGTVLARYAFNVRRRRE